MSVLVNTQNEQEFLDQYNQEIDMADAEIEAGNYVTHQDVEQLFANRRQVR
jgi:hypothetical protein